MIEHSHLVVSQGYPRARPDEMPRHPLDGVIEETIGKIGAAERLYPEIYSWRLRQALLKSIARNSRRSRDELAEVVGSEELADKLLEKFDFVPKDV